MSDESGHRQRTGSRTPKAPQSVSKTVHPSASSPSASSSRPFLDNSSATRSSSAKLSPKYAQPNHDAAQPATDASSAFGTRSAPSMWQAPQSLQHPTGTQQQHRLNLLATEDAAKERQRQQKYFRRVALPNSYAGPPPTMWQRRAQILGVVSSAGIAVYMLVFHDFGPQDHVFRGLRRWIGTEGEHNPFSLSKTEKAWAREKGLIAVGATSLDVNAKEDHHSRERMV